VYICSSTEQSGAQQRWLPPWICRVGRGKRRMDLNVSGMWLLMTTHSKPLMTGESVIALWAFRQATVGFLAPPH